MNGFCPNCGSEDTLSLIREVEEFNVRGEIIPVEVEYYRCKACGEEVMELRTEDDPLVEAYREYRRRTGMMQPNEIREFRQIWDLTQKEFSELLGIGVASLSRYENGSLQELAHDQILKFGMDIANLLKLIEQKPEIIEGKKREEIIQKIKLKLESTRLIDLISERCGNYEPSIYSGFQPLMVEKFIEAIKFFCFEEHVYKTKLMKLLFYADFKHFQEYAGSITGSRYAHLPYGPVPDKYDLWISTLIAEDTSVSKDEIWINENTAEILTSSESPNIGVFQNSEVIVLANVKEFFRTYSAKRITDFSHQEKGYQETKNGQLISYQYSEELKI